MDPGVGRQKKGARKILAPSFFVCGSAYRLIVTKKLPPLSVRILSLIPRNNCPLAGILTDP